MSKNLSIPLEIVDNILDHSSNDLSVLTAASLVCRAWFPSARHHIFSTASLDAANASSFVRLMNTELSTIAHFVHHIEAKDTYENGRWLPSLFPCLSRLSALKSVSITSSFDTTLSEATLFTLGTFDTLIDLSLAECAFENFAQVQQLLCSYPNLERLYMVADWPEPQTVTPAAETPLPCLRELYLRGEVAQVLNWLMTAPHVAPVSKLTLHGIDADDLPVVTRYLQKLGPALTHLTIFPSGSLYGTYRPPVKLSLPLCLSPPTDALCSHLDLSIHPSLEYLKLVIDCDSSNLLMARDVLKQIRSPVFREVELSFYTIRQVAKTADQWASLDSLLMTPQFASLSRVTVSAMIAASMAKQTLGQCHERGILDVVYQ
jgi:hypothetical protein